MKPLTLVVIVLATLSGVFAVGFSLGGKSVKLEDFKEYKASVEARNKLEGELADKDIALMTKQQELSEARDKEVVKYVTVYRDRIKDPVVAQCVRDSGLLDVYDSTVSTPVK
ncbi:putative inner membrane spanin subunit [Phage vB_KsaM-C1]|nr:putative inner membrane spanin subunit [Phage vB_KsaM-C1]